MPSVHCCSFGLQQAFYIPPPKTWQVFKCTSITIQTKTVVIRWRKPANLLKTYLKKIKLKSNFASHLFPPLKHVSLIRGCSTSRGGWVVKAVVLQSIKTAILLRPRFEYRSGLQYWLLEIIKIISLLFK